MCLYVCVFICVSLCVLYIYETPVYGGPNVTSGSLNFCPLYSGEVSLTTGSPVLSSKFWGLMHLPCSPDFNWVLRVQAAVLLLRQQTLTLSMEPSPQSEMYKLDSIRFLLIFFEWGACKGPSYFPDNWHKETGSTNGRQSQNFKALESQKIHCKLTKAQGLCFSSQVCLLLVHYIPETVVLEHCCFVWSFSAGQIETSWAHV